MPEVFTAQRRSPLFETGSKSGNIEVRIRLNGRHGDFGAIVMGDVVNLRGSGIADHVGCRDDRPWLQGKAAPAVTALDEDPAIGRLQGASHG